MKRPCARHPRAAPTTIAPSVSGPGCALDTGIALQLPLPAARDGHAKPTTPLPAKSAQKRPFLTDDGANGFTTSKTRTNRGASGFRTNTTHDTTASPVQPAHETRGTTASEMCTKTAVSHRRWCQRFHNEENPHQQRRFRFQNEHNPRHHCQPRPAHTQNPRHHCRPRPAHTRNPRHHCQRKMHQKQPFLTDNGANGFTTSKTRTNRGASGFTTRKTRTNRGASGFRQPVDRRLECGAWPGFETTLRAKLAARTAEAGGPPPGCTPSGDTKRRHQAATLRGDTKQRHQEAIPRCDRRSGGPASAAGTRAERSPTARGMP